jgi:hypothetical protein
MVEGEVFTTKQWSISPFVPLKGKAVFGERPG